MKNKLLFAFDIVMTILILLGDSFYIAFGGLWLKGCTSTLFVLLGLGNLLFCLKKENFNLKYSVLLVVGLVFAMLGDIVLNVQFVTGAILFAVGHVFFFVSYCFVEKLSWKDLAFGLAIFVPSLLFIVLAPIFDFGGVLMEIVCVVYALVISLMVGKALSNCLSKKNIFAVLIFLGSFLFFFSDLMLLLNVFANLPKFVDVLCLVTYYPAEILFAISVCFAQISKTSQKDR